MATTELVRITAVRALDGGAKLSITAKTGEKTASAVVYATRLPHVPAVGEISASLWQEYLKEADFCHAMETALRAVGANGLSPLQLKERLLRRGIERKTAEAVLLELLERGYLMESEGALREAEKGLAKGWGNRRILMDVRAKGYGEEALLAVQNRLKEEGGDGRLRALLRRRHIQKMPEDGAEKRRLLASLVRYGYTLSEIKKVLSYEEPYLEE